MWWRTVKTETTYHLLPEPRALCETWDYEQILKKDFPELVKAAGIRALELLCDLLETAIRLSRRYEDHQGPEDSSFIWRPVIEGHIQNHQYGIENILVSAVRDAAELLVQNNMTKVSELVRILEERPWRIFHRIALYLLRRFSDAAPNLVAARLTDRTLFDNECVRYEYALLLRENFETLFPEQQQVILDWIEAGPDLQKFKESQEQWTGNRPTDEDATGYRKIWQRDRLAWFREHLPENWKRYYKTLVTEYGEPEHPEYPFYSTPIWTGPTSPKGAEELRVMSIKVIVEFLKSWQPSGNEMDPSPEGLGRELSAVVAQDPIRFSVEAMRFERLDPTYVRALLSGFRDAVKQKLPFEWPPVLELCHWVVDRPREIPGRSASLGEADPDWGLTRKSIADLLDAGLREDTGCIPFNHRSIVWEILHPLTDDPEPTPEYEERFGGSNMDPATLSINTTRGEAMHAVVRYALWVHRHFEKLPDSKERLSRGFDEMPEVRQVLDEHLDVARDPSLTIRSVYGRWFPWLVFLDPAWARDRIDCIFPATESELGFRDAAWETYIILCNAYDNVFEILCDQYKAAVERLGTMLENKKRLADPYEKLAEHLMTFYWRGKLDICDPESLLIQFWNKASDVLRGYALGFVGRSLHNTKEIVPSEILQRLQTLWESRLAIAKDAPTPGNQRAEMAAFGWWFVSGKFEERWAMSQLMEAFKIAGKIEPNHLVVKQLASLAHVIPKEIFQYLEIIIKGDREGWGIFSQREHMYTILTCGLTSKESETREIAENLINYLGSRGYLEFRELLKYNTT